MYADLVESEKSKDEIASSETVLNKTDFSSNDFLGLARSRSLLDRTLFRYQSLCKRGGLLQGAAGSRSGGGHKDFLKYLESKIAKIHGFPDALVCHCGYMANQSLCFLSASEQDVLIFDEGVHISLESGVLSGKGKYYFFRRNDMDHLEKLLIQTQSPKGNVFIGVNSVYSQDGTLSSLDHLIFLSQKYSAKLIVDEAHAIGVFGNGRGFTQNRSDDVFATVVTFGKALGTFGAAILGSGEMKEYLMNFAYPSRFSTALPLYNLVAIDCAYDAMLNAHTERQRLMELRDCFADCFTNAGPGAVQSLDFGTYENAVSFVSFCNRNAIAVNPVPITRRTGKPGAVRISLHVYNTQEEIEELYRLYRIFFREVFRKML